MNKNRDYFGGQIVLIIFPSKQTMALIKDKGENIEPKILIKLELQIIDLKDTEITIILFENDNPDFLVRKQIYEETYKYYNENLINQNNLVNLEVNLSEDIIKVTLTEIQPEENNENFSNSKFNSLKVISDGEKDEQKYSFWDICINENNNGLIDEKMKYIMSGLKDTFYSIYEKNTIDIEIFWNMVPEKNDFNYYNEIPVPMFLRLILNRLENNYYLNEESLKFDIDLFVNNVKKFNLETAEISKDAEIIRTRLFKRIDQLSSKFNEKNQVISNGTSIKITLNSDSGGSGIESLKKMTGKKRKRILADIDIDENMFKDCDDNDDYLFGNAKKRETRSSSHNNNINNKNEDISVDIEVTNEINNKKFKRKKI